MNIQSTFAPTQSAAEAACEQRDIAKYSGSTPTPDGLGFYNKVEIVKGSCRKHTTGYYAGKFVHHVVVPGTTNLALRASSDLWTWAKSVAKGRVQLIGTANTGTIGSMIGTITPSNVVTETPAQKLERLKLEIEAAELEAIRAEELESAQRELETVDAES